jgi:hypothetical protein
MASPADEVYRDEDDIVYDIDNCLYNLRQLVREPMAQVEPHLIAELTRFTELIHELINSHPWHARDSSSSTHRHDA